jgi:hypothetical protein
MAQAEKLRKESSNAASSKAALKKSDILQIIEPKKESTKVNQIKFSSKFFSQVSEYFNENQSTDEIERIMAEALEQYFSK